MKIITQVLGILILLGCLSIAAVHAEPVRIGATLALSGDGAEWGKNAQRGIQLATERINARSGINGDPIEVIYEDYRSSDFKLAANAAEKFVSIDKVSAIVTQWSGDTEVVWPVATKHGVVTLCIGPASDNLTQKSPLVFRVWPSDEGLITTIVEYAWKRGLEKAVVVGALDPYFTELTALTKGHWKRVSGSEPLVQEVAQREMDFRGIALNIKKATPDVIFVHTSYDAEGVIIRRLREVGVRSLIIGTQHSDDPAVMSVAGKHAEGLVYPQYADADPAFRAEFKSRFKVEPGVPAEYAYDAVMILAHSIGQVARGESRTLREGLLSVSSFAGASGLLTLDSSGNRIGKGVEMKVVKNGKGVPIAEK